MEPDAAVAAEDLALESTTLSEAEAVELERQVERIPGDTQSRIKLLGKYFHIEGADDRAKRATHILWFIANRPDHPILQTPFAFLDDILDPAFSEADGLWRKNAERFSQDKHVLSHAAQFFFHADKAAAEIYLSQALRLDPSDSNIESDLALLYSLWGGHEKQAFSAHLKLCQDRSSPRYFSNLTDLPLLAYATGNFVEADQYAKELLTLANDSRDSWNYGNAINQGHTVLGLLALRNSDLAKASDHLRLSIQDIATPQTTSFGPELILAKELIAVGELESAWDYLDKFDRLAGPGHESAFALRYREMSGEEIPQKSSERLEFETALLAHELGVLEGPPYDRLQVHLSEAIENVTQRSRTWARRLKDARTKSDQELIVHAAARKNLYERHLKSLQDLIARTST